MQRKRERRTLLLAILASFLLHFAVGISIASFGDKLQPALTEEDKPSELTLVDLAPTPPPVVPKNAPFIETPENRQTAEQPKEKTFESNANSIAASELPTGGEAPVPSQQGKDRPFLDLETHQHSLATQGTQAQPEPRSSPPTPAATPPPTPPPEPEMLAMLQATPPPPIPPPEDQHNPQTAVATPTPATRPAVPPASAYRREQAQTRVRGNISNRGISSVNAVGTPLGRYAKIIDDAVGSRWYALVDQNRDRINIGTVRVTFVVDRSGRITKLNIVENSSDESFSNLCLQSVQDAKLPPIPDDVAVRLPAEGLPKEVTFVIFPN